LKGQQNAHFITLHIKDAAGPYCASLVELNSHASGERILKIGQSSCRSTAATFLRNVVYRDDVPKIPSLLWT